MLPITYAALAAAESFSSSTAPPESFLALGIDKSGRPNNPLSAHYTGELSLWFRRPTKETLEGKSKQRKSGRKRRATRATSTNSLKAWLVAPPLQSCSPFVKKTPSPSPPASEVTAAPPPSPNRRAGGYTPPRVSTLVRACVRAAGHPPPTLTTPGWDFHQAQLCTALVSPAVGLGRSAFFPRTTTATLD